MQIIENLIPQTLHNQIKETLMGLEFPWYHRDWTSSPTESAIPLDNKTVEHSQFVHSLFLDGKVWSEHYGMAATVLLFLEDKYKIHINKIHRVKANMLLQNQHYPQDCYNTPHVDNMNKGSLIQGKDMNLVYYVNESDGDTVMFNETLSVDNMLNYVIPEKYTVKQRIFPVESNAILFDAKSIHASCPPRNTNRRIVLNFLFEIK